MTSAWAEVILKKGKQEKHSDHFSILRVYEMQELQLGGVYLKRRCIRKKISAFSLAAAAAVMMTAAVIPGTVWASEETGDNIVRCPEEEIEKNIVEETELSDVGNSGETSWITDMDPNMNTAADANDGTNDSGEAVEQDFVYPVLFQMESGEEYEQLSAFLSLSADRFKIYMVTFVDAGQVPVQPEGPVQVSLPVPSEYDMNRVVVSEIAMEGNTPQRTELPGTAENGYIVFQTDHAGVFVLMEKKAQAELPSSLEMTDKVEKLELTKYETVIAGESGSGSVSSVPKTGDQTLPFLWIGASAVVSSGLLLVVIANSTKNSKKS